MLASRHEPTLYAAIVAAFIILVGLLRWESQSLLFDREDYFYDLPESAPAPRLGMDLVTLDDDRLMVNLNTRNFSFSKLCGFSTSGLALGHAHLFVDGKKIQSLYQNSAVIGPLPPGPHTITVTLNVLPDHRALVYAGRPLEVRRQFQAP
jgi:hypothetical protein